MAKQGISDAEILAQIPDARARERTARRDGLRARSARFQRSSDRLILELTNGVQFAIPVVAIPALRKMSAAQISAVALDSSGGALRWDVHDIDLSVAGLVLSAIGKKEQVRQLARLAGSVSSPAKAMAARRNGTKGGRPRKPVL